MANLPKLYSNTNSKSYEKSIVIISETDSQAIVSINFLTNKGFAVRQVSLSELQSVKNIAAELSIIILIVESDDEYISFMQQIRDFLSEISVVVVHNGIDEATLEKYKADSNCWFFQMPIKEGTIENFIIFLSSLIDPCSRNFTSIIQTDIAEAKILEDGKGLLQSILESVAVGIMLVDSAGIIRNINNAGCSIYDYVEEEIVGRHFREFLPDYAQRLGSSLIDRILLNGYKEKAEFLIKTKHGEGRYVSFYFNIMLKDDGSKHAVAAFSDVTNIRKSEKDLIVSKEQAEVANKLKSEFLANVSHEIRTPLNSIIGFANVLLGSGVSEKQAEYLRQIEGSGKDLLDMINDVIDLSKIEAGLSTVAITLFNVYDMLSSIFDKYKCCASEKNINLILHIDSNMPVRIYSDELKLRQIIDNLIENAIKNTDSGYVKFAIVPLATDVDSGLIDIAITVEDTGSGIPSDLLERIFEPFAKLHFTSAKDTAGLGTGLALVKRISDILQAKIAVDTVVGKGSKFTLTMKSLKFVLFVNYALSVQRECFIRSLKPIAVCLENDDLAYATVSKQLTNASIDTYRATSGEQALDLASKIFPQIIIANASSLDDFSETVAKLKQNIKNFSTPIILIGDYAGADLSSEVHLLSDPFDTDALNTLLQQLHPSIVNESECFRSSAETDDDICCLEFLDELPDEFLRVMQSEIIKDYGIVIKSSVVDDIIKFAQKIKDLAENYSLKKMASYASKLLAQAKEFDFSNLPSTLKEFNSFIEIINKIDR